ncbi:hypothetical protein [Amycolatopsis albispora]|uniref:Uncharacterized protein n=1 Tax=Amycolatopsis albispora TaxID=1804986 RepID=A0A344L9R2_9PSEU|nr:hypothetical protein [Amycolatopsis albispora]AXB44786.1 hypothetical protein A4R43_21670 [Amycolatopsis albispora]
MALVRAVVGEERADAEAEAVAELVALCGGRPLAVRVAACRTTTSRHGGVADVVAELADERNRVAGLRVPDGDERSAVQAVFDLSFSRLTSTRPDCFACWVCIRVRSLVWPRAPR